MGEKRKAAVAKSAATKTSKISATRKANGIKGITVAEKSNDPLRDKLLDILRTSGINHKVESRIVFAHTGLYVGDSLFGWVGPGGFSIRCNNVNQKRVCEKHGCTVMSTVNHKAGNYYEVPLVIQNNGKELRSLAEEFIACASLKVPKSVKK